MTDYVLRHINRTRIISIFRRKLLIYTTIIKEDLEYWVNPDVIIADDALFYGQALGYLESISDYLAERETELLRTELQVVREDNKRRVKHYLNYSKYIPKSDIT